jgi:hypothetical protein
MSLNLKISKRGISATSADRIDRGGDRSINRAALARSQRRHEPAGKPLHWSWSYEASQPGAGSSDLKARGTLITDRDADGDGVYEVLRIQGRRNGVRITGLVPAGTAIPGNVDPVTGNPYIVDNRIQPARSGQPGQVSPQGQLNSRGIGFSLADGTYSNIFLATYLDPPRYFDFHTQDPFPSGLVPPNTETTIHFQAQSPGLHF